MGNLEKPPKEPTSSHNGFRLRMIPLGTALILTDASYRVVDGKAGFGFTIWFDGYLIYAGSLVRPKVSSPKEAEAGVILSVVKEAKCGAFKRSMYSPMHKKWFEGSMAPWIGLSILFSLILKRSMLILVLLFSLMVPSLNGFTHNLANDSYKMSNFVGWGGF